MTTPRHNHLTRDMKPEGQCPMCDAYHAAMRARLIRPLPESHDLGPTNAR